MIVDRFKNDEPFQEPYAQGLPTESFDETLVLRPGFGGVELFWIFSLSTYPLLYLEFLQQNRTFAACILDVFMFSENGDRMVWVWKLFFGIFAQ